MEHRQSLILRRSFPDVERALIRRSHEFYGDLQFYNKRDHLWSLPGSRTEFAYLDTDKDLQNYQGAAYDLIGFDELTQHPLRRYLYMLSRARTTDPKQRVRLVSTTNPGNEGHLWVMARWSPWLDRSHPNPAKPGELRAFLRDEAGVDRPVPLGTPGSMTRTFIPAKRRDNRFLTPDYERRLNALEEPFRSQLREGDWEAGLRDDDYQVIPRLWIKAAMDRYRDLVAPYDSPEAAIRAGVFGRLLCIGGDVAEGGLDDTVLALRFERGIGLLIRVHGLNPLEVAGLIIETMREWLGSGRCPVIVDAVGIGSGTYAELLRQGHDASPFSAGSGSDMMDRQEIHGFANKRAAAAWAVREALDPQEGDEIVLPPDETLLVDLAAAHRRPSGDKIGLEPKDKIKERIGRSPDAGDAVEIAYSEDALGSGVGITFVG